MTSFFFSETMWGALLQGLVKTLQISGISIVFTLLIGFFVAYIRGVKVKGLLWLANLYVELFRNTPLLLQLYLYYRGLNSIGIVLSPEVCGVLGLSLYSGAYMSDVFKTALLSIPKTQFEAGLSLGLSRLRVYQQIIIPQAFPVILPPMANQLINLVKNSSLVTFITVNNLFGVIYKGAVDEFRPVEYFIAGACFYIVVSLLISGLVHLIDFL